MVTAASRMEITHHGAAPRVIPTSVPDSAKAGFRACVKKLQKSAITMLFIEFPDSVMLSCRKRIILRLTPRANAAESQQTKTHDKNRCMAGNRG